MNYLTDPWFYLAVVVAVMVSNFLWNLLTKRGKLV